MSRHEFGPSSHRFRNFLLFIVFAAILVLLVGLFRGGAPQIKVGSLPRAVGMHTAVKVAVASNMGLRQANAYYQQNGRAFPLAEEKTGLKRNWLIAPRQGRQLTLNLKAGRADVPGLEDGSAELVIEAQAANVRGSRAVLRQPVTIRSKPPQIAALTTQHYVNQGGADMIVYNVSPGTAESGVEVAGQSFPGYAMPNAPPGTMFALFAFPFNAPQDARFELVARDDAGNEVRQGFPIKTFPQRFATRPMPITDQFIQQVVMPIVAHTPEISDQHDPLKNFLLVNRELRRSDAQKLMDLSKQSATEFLWHQPFTRLAAQTEASFADHRQYVYQGKIVDDEYHLGVDLAGTEHMPILAANSGRVAMAQYFGIYGNTIVLDHGFGLMSLYGHMNDFTVKPGDMVQQGQLLGHSDTTGMAAGDHLHFSILLDGVQIEPKEWWDPHWIHDRIEVKLQQYGGRR